MKTDSKTAERNEIYRRIDSDLDKIISVMAEQPSYYESVIGVIKEAKSVLRKNPSKASALVAQALDLAEEESTLAMDYHRIVDAIAPDDPVLNEPKVLKAKGTYDDAVREAKYKAAVKALEKLKDAIGGRGRPPALSVRIESADIGEDRTVRLIVTNKSNEDLVLNSIYCNADVWKEDVLVEVPVIRSGDSVQVPIKIGDGLTSTAVLHVVIGYTRDLIPVKQKFAFKIFSDKDGSLEV